MTRNTVLALAAAWLLSPAVCFAGEPPAAPGTSSAQPAIGFASTSKPARGIIPRSRNATLTPKIRLVGVDSASHRRKVKLTATITSSATGTVGKISGGNTVRPSEPPAEPSSWERIIWAGM